MLHVSLSIACTGPLVSSFVGGHVGACGWIRVRVRVRVWVRCRCRGRGRGRIRVRDKVRVRVRIRVRVRVAPKRGQLRHLG